MKTTNFNFVGIAYTYIIAILVMTLSSSCSSCMEDEPVAVNTYSYKIKYELPTKADNLTATILVLHKDLNFGHSFSQGEYQMIWKAFVNSECNLETFLNSDELLTAPENPVDDFGYYNYEKGKVCLTPNPYIDEYSTLVSSSHKKNVYTINFEGEEYYMFNPVRLCASETYSLPENDKNSNPIIYLTLIDDFTAYNAHGVGNRWYDARYYDYTNLPLPKNGIRNNRVYIYILEETFNYVEHSRVAGKDYRSYTGKAEFRINTPEDYRLIEYSLEDGSYRNL